MVWSERAPPSEDQVAGAPRVHRHFEGAGVDLVDSHEVSQRRKSVLQPLDIAGELLGTANPPCDGVPIDMSFLARCAWKF